MTQTDKLTNIAGYTINKYCILKGDLIVTQSNYHFPNDITEVYTTGWPIENNPERELVNTVAIWYNKSIPYKNR